MPRGLSRKKNPELYATDKNEESKEKSSKPQARPHARGGVHAMKPEDQTGTHYDTLNRKQMEIACKDRSIHVKDMKKADMVAALVKYDLEQKKQANQLARQAREQREALAKKEQEQRARELERQRKKAELSDLESDLDDDYNNIPRILSDDDEYSVTSSEDDQEDIELLPILPGQRLRLFEWQYDDSPSPFSPVPSFSPETGRFRRELSPENLPRPIIYVPLKVVTIDEQKTVQLPGKDLPRQISPDHAPTLSAQTRKAARNGIMTGALQNAVIESGVYWNERTSVQDFNGRMYFDPVPRSEDGPDPQEVLKKWNAIISQGNHERIDHRLPRREQIALTQESEIQKRVDRQNKKIETYALSEYRPRLCYVPAYLEPSRPGIENNVPHKLDNLFFVRFKHYDVPHYYFWADPEEWTDPTKPNSEFSDETVQNGKQHDGKKWIRVKKASVSISKQPSQEQPGMNPLEDAVRKVERELYRDGLMITVYRRREQWGKTGKKSEWASFSQNFPRLFPSGRLPVAPPIFAAQSVSVAQKIALIDIKTEKAPVFTGREAWTRNDDAYWCVEEEKGIDDDDGRQDGKEDEEDDSQSESGGEDENLSEEDTIASPASESLQRRHSTPGLDPDPTPVRKTRATNRDPSNSPEMTIERKKWEKKFSKHAKTCIDELKAAQNAPLPKEDECPFCGTAWDRWNSQLKAIHVHSHSVEEARPKSWSIPISPPLSPSSCQECTGSSTKPTRKDRTKNADEDIGNSHSAKPNQKKRKGKKPTHICTTIRRPSAESYAVPETESSHIPSPALHQISHIPSDAPEAAFDPRMLSDSDHVPSPALAPAKTHTRSKSKMSTKQTKLLQPNNASMKLRKSKQDGSNQRKRKVEPLDAEEDLVTFKRPKHDKVATAASKNVLQRKQKISLRIQSTPRQTESSKPKSGNGLSEVLKYVQTSALRETINAEEATEGAEAMENEVAKVSVEVTKAAKQTKKASTKTKKTQAANPPVTTSLRRSARAKKSICYKE